MRAAEYARERLAQACECPDGSRALVIALAEGDAPPIVRRLVERRLTIGDSATLAVHPFYQNLFTYFESIGAYHTVWEEEA